MPWIRRAATFRCLCWRYFLGKEDTAFFCLKLWSDLTDSNMSIAHQLWINKKINVFCCWRHVVNLNSTVQQWPVCGHCISSWSTEWLYSDPCVQLDVIKHLLMMKTCNIGINRAGQKCSSKQTQREGKHIWYDNKTLSEDLRMYLNNKV